MHPRLASLHEPRFMGRGQRLPTGVVVSEIMSVYQGCSHGCARFCTWHNFEPIFVVKRSYVPGTIRTLILWLIPLLFFPRSRACGRPFRTCRYQGL